MTLTGKQAAIALLFIQSAIALSVAGKYALDRAMKPRVWVRAQQYDPSTPLRGRYLALQLTVDGCTVAIAGAQPPDSFYGSFSEGLPRTRRIGRWPVKLSAEHGHLIARADTNPAPDNTQTVLLWSGQDCHIATLDHAVDFFLPEHAASPLPSTRNADLWVEVTVPSTGPPRPIQLAISDKTGWHVLKE